MRDIEFLTTDRPFSGAVIYRYRSGVLRKSMIAWAEAAAKRQEQDCIYLGYEDLAIDWFNENALFPGARICVPPPGSSKKAVKLLRPFLEAPPASPTLICVRADKSNDVRHPGITVVDELVVTLATLPAALRYVAATSDLIGAELDIRPGCVSKAFPALDRDGDERRPAGTHAGIRPGDPAPCRPSLQSVRGALRIRPFKSGKVPVDSRACRLPRGAGRNRKSGLVARCRITKKPWLGRRRDRVRSSSRFAKDAVEMRKTRRPQIRTGA